MFSAGESMYSPLDYMLLALAVVGVSIIGSIILIHALRTMGLMSSDFVTGQRVVGDGRRVSRRRRRVGASG